MSTNAYKQCGDQLTVNLGPAEHKVKPLETAQDAIETLVEQQNKTPTNSPTAARGRAATCRMI